MKTRLYKFIELGNQDTRYEIFDCVEVLTEKELRDRFVSLLDTFPKELIAEYNLSCVDSCIGDIIDALNDVCNYNPAQYYLVQEIDVDIDVREPVHHATLLATLHKDTYPEKPNTEVIDTVENYLKEHGEM